VRPTPRAASRCTRRTAGAAITRELRSQVAQRAALTGRPFTHEDLDDIAEYLNLSHYRFKK